MISKSRLKESRKGYNKKYNSKPEVKKRIKEYKKKYLQENKEKIRIYKKEYRQKNKSQILKYNQSPKVKTYFKEYAQRPEVIKKRKKYSKIVYQKRKEERIKKYGEKTKECIECGKLFKPHYSKKTCSDECKEKRRLKQKTSKKEYYKKYRQKNKKLIKIKNKKWYEKNKEKHKELMKEWKKNNPNHHKEYYQKNKKIFIERAKEYSQTPKAKEKRKIYYTKYERERKKTDKNYKLMGNLRSNFNSTIKKYSKTGKIVTASQYGINYKAIIEHLKPFPKDIENYEVDHIVPLSWFDFNNPKEIKWAFAPENHQWLTKEENRTKLARWMG